MGPGGQMSWYKFIIYFQLFAAAVICFINAITAVASEEMQYLSERIDEFGAMTTFYCIAMLCLGIDALITRSSLANFKEKAPRRYVCFVLANTLISLLYVIWMNGILEDYYYEVDNTYAIVSIITNFVMALANWIYFDNRKELFKY